jgi:hypothetical protein
MISGNISYIEKNPFNINYVGFYYLNANEFLCRILYEEDICTKRLVWVHKVCCKIKIWQPIIKVAIHTLANIHIILSNLSSYESSVHYFQINFNNLFIEIRTDLTHNTHILQTSQMT